MIEYKILRNFLTLLGCVFSFLTLSSCEDVLTERVIVYSDDFSQTDPNSPIVNAKWHAFNGDTLLGWYHNEEIALDLASLPKHNTLEITVELLVHDSWDGNQEGVGGSDYWFLHLDGEEIINTTFSNSPCGFNYCLYQAYPENFPRTFEPKTGALETNLPGRCQYKGVSGWTSKYRITRLIKHQSSSLSLLIGDRLKQENAGDPSCDESWSVSKIEISALTVD
ncbi:MAG TPA: hypothetical protein VK014_10165 [Cyclobacteriaceae bacterium]|nr:hypothetical protein [Cyclobacteriaceae bacterium]